MSNKSFDSARAKGFAAAKAGKRITDNPYGDARTHRGSVTFARAYWRAWRAGFEEHSKRNK